MADLLALFRTNIDGVRARRKKIQGELETARRQREQLRTLPLPAEELVGILMEILDRRRARYEQRISTRAFTLGHDFIIWGAESRGAINSGILVDAPDGVVGAGALEVMLVSLFRDQVREGLLKMIKARNLKTGAPRAERLKQLEQIEERIKDLEAQEKAVEVEIDGLRKELDG